MLANGGLSSGYELACSFQVRCPDPNMDRLVIGRFPPNLGCLGKTPLADKLGIVPQKDFRDPYMVVENKSEIKVDLIIVPGLKVKHQMTYFERSGKQMQQCDAYALIQTRNKTSSYWLRLPADGFYLLTIYAAEIMGSQGAAGRQSGSTLGIPGDRASNAAEQVSADQLECVLRYLIDARKPTTRMPSFPQQSSRWCGCYVSEPLQRQVHLQSKCLFRVETAPQQCSSLSVVLNGQTWLDLKSQNKAATSWAARINTGDQPGELSLYGRMKNDAATPNSPVEEQERFIKLLDYELVSKPASHK